MALKEIKVEPRTLEQISDIINKNPEGADLVQKNLIETINKLWHSVCAPKVSLLLVDEISIELHPKSEYYETVKNLTGHEGPYTAVKTYKSWIGLSEGIYQLKNSNVFAPVSWFDPIKQSNLQKLLTIGLIILSIIQSLILLVVLL